MLILHSLNFATEFLALATLTLTLPAINHPKCYAVDVSATPDNSVNLSFKF